METSYAVLSGLSGLRFTFGVSTFVNYVLFCGSYFFVTLFEHPFTRRWRRLAQLTEENISTVAALRLIDEEIAKLDENITRLSLAIDTESDLEQRKKFDIGKKTAEKAIGHYKFLKLSYRSRTKAADVKHALEILLENVIDNTEDVGSLTAAVRAVNIGQNLSLNSTPLSKITVVENMQLLDNHIQ